MAISILRPQTKCPDCGVKLPRFRVPRSASQSLHGGCTCPSCGCEVDRHGNKIQASEDAPATTQTKATGQFVGLKLKTCPKCAEKIQIDALICRHCGQEFSADDVATVKQQALETAARAEQKANAGVRRTWGTIFSMLGGLILFIAAILLIFMISYSVSPNAAKQVATTGIRAIIIPFVCVPLPLLLIGGAVFYLGRKWVRAASALG